VITFERNFLARSAGPVRSPALVLQKDLAGVQANAFPPSEQLDHELLTSENPFDGLADLLTELAIPEVNQILSSSRAEIVAFPPAGLNFAQAGQPLTRGTCLQQGELNIVIWAHSQGTTRQAPNWREAFPVAFSRKAELTCAP
jgi:hypothetical protein